MRYKEITKNPNIFAMYWEHGKEYANRLVKRERYNLFFRHYKKDHPWFVNYVKNNEDLRKRLEELIDSSEEFNKETIEKKLLPKYNKVIKEVSDIMSDSLDYLNNYLEVSKNKLARSALDDYFKGQVNQDDVMSQIYLTALIKMQDDNIINLGDEEKRKKIEGYLIDLISNMQKKEITPKKIREEIIYNAYIKLMKDEFTYKSNEEVTGNIKEIFAKIPDKIITITEIKIRELLAKLSKDELAKYTNKVAKIKEYVTDYLNVYSEVETNKNAKLFLDDYFEKFHDEKEDNKKLQLYTSIVFILMKKYSNQIDNESRYKIEEDIINSINSLDPKITQDAEKLPEVVNSLDPKITQDAEKLPEVVNSLDPKITQDAEKLPEVVANLSLEIYNKLRDGKL